MYTIRAKNVNEAYPVGIMMLKNEGQYQPSQHGGTYEMDQPVSVMYDNPRERCLFDEKRDSNPFLNLFEALWIIAGRNDTKFLERLVPQMKNYSDDGVNYFGAYGYRIRYPVDQIKHAIARLKANPDDRQVVLTIRQASDIAYKGKDQPCNLLVACKIRNGKLNIHVFNRSNDFIWGLTGTNVVQFSMLQEYMAGRIGVGVGTYHQTTDSMHVYANEQWDKLKDTSVVYHDPYSTGEAAPFDMMELCSNGAWDKDLGTFFRMVDSGTDANDAKYGTPFFLHIVAPAWDAFLCWEAYRQNKDSNELAIALHLSSLIPADWGLMINKWLSRRVK